MSKGITVRTSDEKKDWVDRALSSGRYDNSFVALSRKQAKSSHNVNNVITDINSYSSSKVGIKQAHTQYVSDTINQFKNPILVTLTTRYDSSTNKVKSLYDNLIKQTSHQVYGRAYKRYKKMLGNIGYIEGADSNIHIHAVFDKPEHVGLTEFRTMIASHWQSHAGHIDFKVLTGTEKDNDAVANYMTKVRSKEGFDTMQDALVIY